MRRSLLAISSVVALALGVAQPVMAKPPANPNSPYIVEVLRTSYGIPHIQARDWGSLGYGFGYTMAEDNLCVLAREILLGNGELSRYFGAGAGNSNLISDWTYKMVNAPARFEPAWASLDADTQAVMEGYAAGYNRYLRDKGSSAGSAECRGKDWVQPIDSRDLYRMLRKLLVLTSTNQFAAGLVAATPPVVVAGTQRAPSALDSALALAAETSQPDFTPERFGSNAVALGSDYTGGRGALLGNPHFPWAGIQRFYGVHLTIPGTYDVMGAAIYGFPLINIGFNRDVAWSHTVSTGRRFVFRELTLVPGKPTSYVYNGKQVDMVPETVTAQVLQANGTLLTVPRTFYQTQFGPIVVFPPATWTASRAYAFTDVNLDNTRSFAMWREMGMARSVDELDAAIKKNLGMPWVNTIATDRLGNAYYADISVTPHVTNAKLASCSTSAVAQALAAGRIYVLDGARPECDPGTDADAPVPGIFGPGNLPSLTRRDFVQNSNDSYWLANPAAPLTGFSRLIGADENRPQGFRTRLGITQIRARESGADGLPGGGFDQQWLQDVLFQNRNYSADLVAADVIKLCKANPTVVLNGTPISIASACNLLDAWDKRQRTESVGAHLWVDLWRRLSAGQPANFYLVPFNPADPVNTPNTLNAADPAVRTKVLNDFASMVKYFADNNIPLDATWGSVHFESRNGERIPIHGGPGPHGVYNAMVAATPPGRGAGEVVPGVGYTPIASGSSYIQAVTFTNSGPDARALVTYSQSTDPENPHFADLTKLYSRYGWVQLPFAEGDIRRDPALTVLKLREMRR